MRLIDADRLEKYCRGIDATYNDEPWMLVDILSAINDMPTVDALEVTEKELRHLINDVIAYIWRLEDRGCDKPEFGYDSRKALLEKLKRFEKEHFPQYETEG